MVYKGSQFVVLSLCVHSKMISAVLDVWLGRPYTVIILLTLDGATHMASLPADLTVWLESDSTRSNNRHRSRSTGLLCLFAH